MPSHFLLSLKVLRRRPFFTFVSLFGIAFTLTTLLIVAAVFDAVLAPRAPEIHQDRSLYLSYVVLEGENNTVVGGLGYGLVERYLRDLPATERTTVYTAAAERVSFVDGNRIETDVRRTDAAYWEAFRFDFLEGGAFDARDVADSRAVVVIDASTRLAVFGGGPAVGRSFEIDGRGYEVIGVVRDVGALRNATSANAWAPLTTQAREDWRTLQSGDLNMCIVAESAAAFGMIKEEIATRLAAWEPVPGLPFETAETAPLTRLEELAAESRGSVDAGADVGRFVGLVTLGAFVFMLLPALNLVNVNMSRILERASEIGVRKAFGASTTTLVRQFVFENVVLCLLGGLLSLALAALLIAATADTSWIGAAELKLSGRVFLVGLGLAVLFGVVSGIVPAWRMARLHPIEALRGGDR